MNGAENKTCFFAFGNIQLKKGVVLCPWIKGKINMLVLESPEDEPGNGGLGLGIQVAHKATEQSPQASPPELCKDKTRNFSKLFPAIKVLISRIKPNRTLACI